MSIITNMNILALITFLFVFQMPISRSQLPYSVFSCALGKNTRLPKSRKNIILRGFGLVEDNVFFYLYTKENTNGQEIILNDVEHLKSSTFNNERPTKIITHGYISSRDSDACVQPKDALLKSGDYNVIIVDWWEMQSVWGIPLLYGSVCGYVTDVGNYVAKMINFLENEGLNLKTTTLVGHSLGAHVMGIAGYHIRNKVNYVVGLDPALPNFESCERGERLSVEDAVTVLVIHTNEGHCGMSQPIGHYDFYPNGGAKQPGCTSNRCSHSRVYELYAESIQNGKEFYSRLCSNFNDVKEGNCTGEVIKMNENMREQNAKEGIYYFETNDSPPYV